MSDLKFECIPDYGYLMTLTQFIRIANDSLISSDDGIGYYATKHSISNREVSPTQHAGPHPTWATHVIWFSK